VQGSRRRQARAGSRGSGGTEHVAFRERGGWRRSGPVATDEGRPNSTLRLEGRRGCGKGERGPGESSIRTADVRAGRDVRFHEARGPIRRGVRIVACHGHLQLRPPPPLLREPGTADAMAEHFVLRHRRAASRARDTSRAAFLNVRGPTAAASPRNVEEDPPARSPRARRADGRADHGPTRMPCRWETGPRQVEIFSEEGRRPRPASRSPIAGDNGRRLLHRGVDRPSPASTVRARPATAWPRDVTLPMDRAQHHDRRAAAPAGMARAADDLPGLSAPRSTGFPPEGRPKAFMTSGGHPQLVPMTLVFDEVRARVARARGVIGRTRTFQTIFFENPKAVADPR